jgi:hypothetical protein
MRKVAYKGYAKMIAVKKSEKPEEVLAELRESFGSAQGLADANNAVCYALRIQMIGLNIWIVGYLL